MQVLTNAASATVRTPISGVSYDPIGPRLPSSAAFDPKRHLCYQPPTKKYTFSDLGISVKGITPVAVTEASCYRTRFVLKRDAILELRKDCLSSKVLDDFTCTTKLAAHQAREFPQQIAPFINQAFSSPEFVQACSDAAGIDLVPIMPMELGHTNFQLGNEGKAGIRALGSEPSLPEPPSTQTPKEDGTSNWHVDAYPFVAVTMLSDVTNMIGGETAIERGDGTIAKIRGPQLGWTTVMQGHYLKHLACKAYNAKERITMVTSFRARDPSLADESFLLTIRNMAKRNRINAQWSTYRLRLVAERMSKLATEIEEAGRDDILAEKDVCNKESMQKFVNEQIEYLQFGIEEMMP
ncbi:MAG: hypothetical protein CYPHOPRED_005400 [Cyphobasidiales sp. Tagirdzhanova-0007]|nr:MAG: hypothetical protein CYPHOPRED_005400 [Cyphobasidiales sp. Tagirdzhanova-0007]